MTGLAVFAEQEVEMIRVQELHADDIAHIYLICNLLEGAKGRRQLTFDVFFYTKASVFGQFLFRVWLSLA